MSQAQERRRVLLVILAFIVLAMIYAGDHARESKRRAAIFAEVAP